MPRSFMCLLLTGSLCAVGQPILSMEMDNMQDNKSGMMMKMRQMMAVTEEDLLSNFSEQDKTLYQQLSTEQKALVIRAANQACKIHMQKMQQMMKQAN